MTLTQHQIGHKFKRNRSISTGTGPYRRTTEFNTQKLLDGSFKGIFQIGANENQNLSLTINDMRGYALQVVGGVTYSITGTFTPAASGSLISDGTYTVSYDGTKYLLKDQAGNIVATSTDGKSYTNAANDAISFNDPVISGQITINGTNATV